MSFWHKFLLKFSVTVTVMISFHQEIIACSCAKFTLEESFQMSAAVFTGKVISANEPSRPSFFQKYIPFLKQPAPKMTTFEVSQVWKGPRNHRLVINQWSGKCGRSFEKGKEYLVYADGIESNLSAELCTRVLDLGDAKEDLSLIGEGIIIPRSVGTSLVKPFLWAIGVIGALMVAAVITVRRRRISTSS